MECILESIKQLLRYSKGTIMIVPVVINTGTCTCNVTGYFAKTVTGTGQTGTGYFVEITTGTGYLDHRCRLFRENDHRYRSAPVQVIWGSNLTLLIMVSRYNNISIVGQVSDPPELGRSRRRHRYRSPPGRRGRAPIVCTHQLCVASESLSPQ